MQIVNTDKEDEQEVAEAIIGTHLWRQFRFWCKTALKDNRVIILLKLVQISNSVKLIDQL